MMEDQELLLKFNNASYICPPGSRWQHYYRCEVTILAVALDGLTQEPCIIYQHDGINWMRKISDFLGDAKDGDRFTRIE